MTEKKVSSYADILQKSTAFYTAEKPEKESANQRTLSIGVPMETSLQENRVSLKPESVGVLVSRGHKVLIETGAGESSNYSDQEYSEAGAQITYDRREVFHSEIIMKVEPPTQLELDMIKPGVALISAFQPGTQNVEFLNALAQKRITALGYEFIEDKVGGLPLVRSMSEIAGSSVMLIAAELLSKTNGGPGIILGGVTGVPSTNVVIVGAGTVAEYAARAAMGLGVNIVVFDNHIYKLRRLKHAIGHELNTSTLDSFSLTKALKEADVVIGAVRSEKGQNRMVITEEMVSQMRPGSVIIDVSIDQGGCVETSRQMTLKSPTFIKYGITHYCVPNIASRVARTATIAISNIFTPILVQIADAGGVDEMIFTNKWLMKGVYMYKGYTTNLHLAKKYNLAYKDLSLLMAARF